MVARLLLPVLFLPFLLGATSASGDSDVAALRRVLSDLGLPRVNDPCTAPGVSCEPSPRATRLVYPASCLAGFLSRSVGRLSYLRELSLPDNRLSGALPRELAACRALEVLDLRGNRLSGLVPRELSALSSLRELDLSSNRLAGDLRFLDQLPNLERLSLAGNLFSGRVPRSLASLRNLTSVDISDDPSLSGDVQRPPAALSLPRRYLYAPNATRNHTSRAPLTAFAPAPSPAAHHARRHHHSTRRRLRNWLVGFLVGVLAGVLSGLLLSVLFRMLQNCVRGRYRNPGRPMIYSLLIKHAEHLAFLDRDDGLASLEKIGEGGCGEVYKAQLPSTAPDKPGVTVAIKRIMKRSADGGEPGEDETKQLDKWMRQIRSEINTVGHIRHRNLLPLLAHVSRSDCHYLVYEFMKNGSLRDALREAAEGRRSFGWPARLRIAQGIASGLEYLHINYSPRIIHRDLKPANILVDDALEARIADFGLAKQVPDEKTHMTTSNVAGTAGYIAPEYHQLLKFTDKCDVYSFGIILAVLVVGKEPTDDFFQETNEMNIVKWMRNMMHSENPAAAIDPVVAGEGFEEQMLLVLKIACCCTADDPKERPNSKDIRSMLSQIEAQH